MSHGDNIEDLKDVSEKSTENDLCDLMFDLLPRGDVNVGRLHTLLTTLICYVILIYVTPSTAEQGECMWSFAWNP